MTAVPPNNNSTSKAINWIVGAFVLAGLGLFIFLLVSPTGFHDIRELLNPNSITIETDSDLDREKVEIIWSTELAPTRKVVDNGQELDVTYKVYGPNVFIITYDQDSVGAFSYFKTNNWHGHHHHISLKQTDAGDIECHVEITDPDPGEH